MRVNVRSVLVAVTLACVTTMANATDVWEVVTDSDNSVLTDNVLWHNAPAQIHDLQAVGGVSDQDWYIVAPIAQRSYEVQVLNVTGDTSLNAAGSFVRFAADGTTVLQDGSVLGFIYLRTLRWVQPTGDSTLQFVRVAGQTNGTANAQYSIQLRETTQYCARYNNAATQVSVLIIQRMEANSNNACNYEVRYNNGAGVEVGNSTGTLALATSVAVIQTAAVPGLAGTSGSAYIAHTCGIGGINAKMVALEPATGFSFDTPCKTRESN